MSLALFLRYIQRMSGFPITSPEAFDEVNHRFYKNLVLLASKPIPPVQAYTKTIVPANTVDVAPALPSPKPAAVLVSPVLPKSAQRPQPTNADDVHSSALLASPFNMLFSNISNPSVPDFIVQNNQLSETSMIRDYPISFTTFPRQPVTREFVSRRANLLPITPCLIIPK